MKTIHKFRLECGKEPNTLKLREGYRVVRCEYVVPQKGVYLWVEQPLNVAIPVVERQFVVVYSGDPVPTSYQHLDTALDPFGPEAYHIFAVDVAPADKVAASHQQASPTLFRSASQQVGTA
ncbi:hypothetical protein FDP08_12470 [Marinobacter panjinensis]|uniref:DUF7352 domain-containing protein n=1 Tax=Marinobacter panjinensis TaxID=2576384 RepID=A0A4V6CXU7_9GAMM|nr:hypothetical protein [Marinobacter panjinensis]MCR8914310.1 hypothetical protein [Marinobacter panjinensis]TKV68845.1 hypothetical protein FDP08_12470 [Marinobacter panjinensis]